MHSISYIITVYNKAKALPLLVESLRNQEGDFVKEFIFVDDGSTDNSVDVLKPLVQNLGGDILHQSNQGPSVALNLGLKHAKHDLAFLIDGDDYSYPDASKTLLNLVAQYPDAVLFKGVHVNNPEHSNIIFDNKISYMQDPLPIALKFYPVGASTTMVNRKIAQQVGGCDENVFIQDYSIALRMALYGGFVEINKLVAKNIDVSQQRLSTNKLRENYCTAQARLNFIQNNLNIIQPQYKYYGLQHQLRKAWLWHLKNKFPPNFKHFWRYLISRFPGIKISDTRLVEWLAQSLEVYKF